MSDINIDDDYFRAELEDTYLDLTLNTYKVKVKASMKDHADRMNKYESLSLSLAEYILYIYFDKDIDHYLNIIKPFFHDDFFATDSMYLPKSFNITKPLYVHAKLKSGNHEYWSGCIYKDNELVPLQYDKFNKGIIIDILMRKGPPAPINYPIEEWDGLDHLREHGIATVTDLLESFFYFFNKEIESTDFGYL